MERYAVPLVFLGTFSASYILVKLIVSLLHKRDHHLPPSLRQLPVIGSTLIFVNFSEWPIYLLKKSGEIGDVFGAYLGSQYTVILNSRQAVYDALVKQSSDFAGRPQFTTNLLAFNVNNKGVLDHQYNAQFRKQHQLILSILREFGFGQDVIMETRILREVSSLMEYIRNLNGEPFQPNHTVTTSVLKVIISIVVGHHFDDSTINDAATVVHEFVIKASAASDIDIFPLLRFIPHYRRILSEADASSQKLLKFAAKCITNCTSDSFVKYYMEREGSGVDEEQLIYIVRDLLLAGTETSASTVLWSMVLLANNSEIQTKMREELDSVIPRDSLPSLDHKSDLHYVEAVICEIMRIRTQVPLALFHMTTCDTNIGEFFIPANTMVIPNLYAVHHDPAVWEDPHVFRPERFLDDIGNVVGKEQVIPFSLGRRSCLGEILAKQEIFLFLTSLVQNFIFKPPEGQENVECKERFNITLTPSPFQVRLIPRT